ncbi:uncharacterized protein LOC131231054 [Magnolia sinica]|uniref:uncharacterized protein LOC131231054 n=1 Tax=Magnolia sinica TaxID=86752 RepID=UPI00265B22EE|nr:uncharacterized protein LOC131231054 [Magnolia sinica]
MAHRSHYVSCSPGCIRLILVLVGICLVGYIATPPLYWHMNEIIAGQDSCPPCICDCSAESILSMPLGLANSSFEDCGRHDPDTNEEMEKTITDLLAEELRLRAEVTKDHMQHAEASILEAKKTSSQYQKEAEKCNSGMETCEEAREKAEAALRAELKLSALWEKRARHLGWTDRKTASS